MTSKPVYSGAILGWRSWKITEDRDLFSIGFGNKVWGPGENIAECVNLDIGHIEKSPASNCECGLYAYYTPQPFPKSPRLHENVVRGLVLARGKVELHDTGFRAEKMTILGLVDSGNIATREAIYKYGAPSFHSASELARYAEEISKSSSIASEFKKTDVFNNLNDSIHKSIYRSTDQNGELHSFNDRPAIIYADGSKEWRQHGLLHRENNLPAFIGSQEKPLVDADYRETQYWQKGRLYRENGLPARIVTYAHGEIFFWYDENNQLHRENDLPAVEAIPDPGYMWRVYPQEIDEHAVLDGELGTKKWFSRGLLHRDENLGPAVIANNHQLWVQNNKFHRESGPALTGGTDDLFFLDDRRVDEEVWREMVQNKQSKSV